MRNMRSILRKRKGAALIMALLVLLVGGGITAVMLEMVHNYAWASVGQRRIYVDHTTVVDMIQTAKGYILSANEKSRTAMHAPRFDLSNPASRVTHVSDLLFQTPELSLSRTVRSGVGLQRLELSVYDMFFTPDRVDNSVLNDADQVKDLPSVLKISGIGSGGGFEPEGENTTSGTGSNDSYGEHEIDPKKCGAYLVRVKLYDRDGALLRTAEEAFVQVLP
jgi:hypothetical protein